MAELQGIFRNGQLFGNSVVKRSDIIVDPLNIATLQGIEVKFFSPTEELVGGVGTTFDNSTLVDLEMNVKKISGLENFSFKIPRNINIPFYNLMEVRFYKNSNHWYTGELEFKPTQDQRKVLQTFSGKGYYHYLKKIKIDKLYQNKTIKEIIVDILENEVQPNTPILFDVDLINPPSYTITKIQFKKKTAEKALIEMLKLANVNYNTQQYQMGVNKSKRFYFDEVSNDLVNGFIEGFQFQDPSTDQDIDSIINQIDLYRAQENSQTVEFISRVEDTESQGLYGIRNRDITISDYVDTTTAQRIANAIIAFAKSPFLEVKTKNQKTGDLPFDIGFYKVINRKIEYTKVLSEFDDLTKWTTSLSSTTIVESSEKVFSGKKAFKVNTTSGSQNDYIEFELDETIYFPSQLIFYVSQEPAGLSMDITLFDEDGNEISTDEDFILQEDGVGLIQKEDGTGYIEKEQSGLDILLRTDYQKITFDISALNNVAKVRITFVTNSNFLIYLDRLEILTDTYFQNILSIDKLKYKLEKNALLSDITFGEEQKNLVTDIKELSDKQINTINIFQKL